jgi:hypothetical protein
MLERAENHSDDSRMGALVSKNRIETRSLDTLFPWEPIFQTGQGSATWRIPWNLL